MSDTPQHYFSDHPTAASDRRSVRLTLRDVQLTLRTDSGVFSPDQIDPGTLVLLSHAPPPPPTGTLLDLGCGYGPVALTLARRAPGATVWAVDVNERALELARENAETAGCDNVRMGRPEEIPDEIRFAAIYSNPPIKVGKAVLHAMLRRWLLRLDTGGTAYVVVHRHLGSDSLHQWLTDQGLPTVRLASHRGYRILAVTQPPGQEPLS